MESTTKLPDNVQQLIRKLDCKTGNFVHYIRDMTTIELRQIFYQYQKKNPVAWMQYMENNSKPDLITNIDVATLQILLDHICETQKTN